MSDLEELANGVTNKVPVRAAPEAVADPSLAKLSPGEQSKVGIGNTLRNHMNDVGAGIAATQAKVRDAITPWYAKTQTAGDKQAAATAADYATPQPAPVAPPPVTPAALAPTMTPATTAAASRTANTYAADKAAVSASAPVPVSNPAQLAADQARYDQEQAVYRATPQPAAQTQMAQMAAAPAAPTPPPARSAETGHVFKAGGLLSEAMAEALTKASANRAHGRNLAADAPHVKAGYDAQAATAKAGVDTAAAATKAGTDNTHATHLANLKQSDPLQREQVGSAKAANAAAARRSQLEEVLVNPKATAEEKAAATETIRDLAGKEDQTKIAVDRGLDGDTSYAVSGGRARKVADIAAETTAVADKARYAKYKPGTPVAKAIDDEHLAAVQNAKNPAAMYVNMNDYRRKHGLPPLPPLQKA